VLIRRFLAAAAVVAATLAGAPSATAVAIMESHGFGISSNLNVVVSGSTSVVTGTFLPNASNSPLNFAQFNTMGGTLILNSVVISLAQTTPTLSALVSNPTCDLCSASATNVSVFSVGVDAPTGGAFDFALLPLMQTLTGPTASGACDSSESSCTGIFSNPSTILTLAAFAFNSTPAQLGAFIGGGTFQVVPGVVFAGTYTVDNENSPNVDNSTIVGSQTTWNGTVIVTYNYTDTTTPSIPEPATLALVGIALAALGFTLLKRKTTA